MACMGNVAASGGYYIACPATRIVAQPSTLTGSIGVITGKFNFDGPLRLVSPPFLRLPGRHHRRIPSLGSTVLWQC